MYHAGSSGQSAQRAPCLEFIDARGHEVVGGRAHAEGGDVVELQWQGLAMLTGACAGPTGSAGSSMLVAWIHAKRQQIQCGLCCVAAG